MEKPTPPTFSGLVAQVLARVLASRTGTSLAAVFVVFQIYLTAISPAWQQAEALRGEWANLETKQRDSEAARQRRSAEANRLAEAANLQRAEADAALQKAKADADLKEAEADESYAVALASPALRKALADEQTQKGRLLARKAEQERDLAKAEAERMEQQAKQALADAQYQTALVGPEIAKLRSEASNATEILRHWVGAQLPETFSFDSDK